MKIIKHFKKNFTIAFGLFFISLNGLSQDNTSLNAIETNYQSKYVEVHGSKMHYLETGEGDPILFIHGNPTSSFLWRNVFPYVKDSGRLIAVDLIGFGKSGKPNIEYSYKDQFYYLESFIETLNLKNITLVFHDWGSVLGLNYTVKNESNVKGIVLMEALISPFVPIDNYEALGQMGETFKMWRETEAGSKMVIDQNIFIEKLLPSSIIRKLMDEELEAYRQPFREKQSRKVILRLVKELPIGNKPEYVNKVIQQYNDWLVETSLPKLHIYASPGGINPPKLVKDLTTKLKNYETVFVGEGKHFLQEDQPEAIGRAIADWYRRINIKKDK